MSEPQTRWYIVQTADGPCQILPETEIDLTDDTTRWGPFKTQADAITRRVGLIRSGKCKPI